MSCFIFWSSLSQPDLLVLRSVSAVSRVWEESVPEKESLSIQSTCKKEGCSPTEKYVGNKHCACVYIFQ